MGYLPLDPAADGLNLSNRERLARRMVLKRREDEVEAAEAARMSVEKLLPSVLKRNVDSVRVSEPLVSGEAVDMVKEPIRGFVLGDLLKQVRPDSEDS